MLALIGFAVVIASVLYGYTHGGGDLRLLVQPGEIITILGAAVGAFVASCTSYSFRQAVKRLPEIIFPKAITKKTYSQVLSLLYVLFSKMHREGIISIEKDIEDHKNSSIYHAFPSLIKDAQLCNFINDTLRTFLTTGKADDLAELMDLDRKSIDKELHVAPKGLERMAESLPGFGIVAAVMGVVITMKYIDQEASVLGGYIGAALLGTFLGILLCYGIFGPIAAKLENLSAERATYLHCVRESIMAALRGLSPIIALEYGRRTIPPAFRPSFTEMEQTLKGGGAK